MQQRQADQAQMRLEHVPLENVRESYAGQEHVGGEDTFGGNKPSAVLSVSPAAVRGVCDKHGELHKYESGVEDDEVMG